METFSIDVWTILVRYNIFNYALKPFKCVLTDCCSMLFDFVKDLNPLLRPYLKYS